MQTADSFTQVKPLSAARIGMITGLSLLLMAILAGIIVGGVFSIFDTQKALADFQANINSLRWGILGWIGILILDILVAWGFYVIFNPIQKEVSRLTAWFRLIYTSMLGLAIGCLIMLLQLANGTVSADPAWAPLLWSAYQQIWSVGLIIFGLHLLGLGYLAFKKGLINQIIAWLLFIAGTGYLILSTGELVVPNFSTWKTPLEMVFMLPMIVGEVGLGIAVWVKKGQW